MYQNLYKVWKIKINLKKGSGTRSKSLITPTQKTYFNLLEGLNIDEFSLYQANVLISSQSYVNFIL